MFQNLRFRRFDFLARSALRMDAHGDHRVAFIVRPDRQGSPKSPVVKREEIARQFELPERKSKIATLLKQDGKLYCICRSPDSSRFMMYKSSSSKTIGCGECSGCTRTTNCGSCKPCKDARSKHKKAKECVMRNCKHK
ncbi:unnamed protein product, partial [Nesidiocoris tenuis]